MATLSNRPGYSIAAVSKLTGVSCHALRVWERRYGYPEPQRSPSGHRRYNKEQVVVLRKLTKLAQAGHSIGEVIGDYQAGRLEILEDEAERPGRDSIYSLVVDHLFAGELAEADVLIDLEAERASPIELIERVIEPAMVDIGERWFRGEAQIFQERFATAYLFGRLGRMLDLARRVNLEPTRTVIIGAVEGDHHGGGVLMVGLALEVAGWRALVLGVDIPVEELPEGDQPLAARRPGALVRALQEHHEAVRGAVQDRQRAGLRRRPEHRQSPGPGPSPRPDPADGHAPGEHQAAQGGGRDPRAAGPSGRLAGRLTGARKDDPTRLRVASSRARSSPRRGGRPTPAFPDRVRSIRLGGSLGRGDRGVLGRGLGAGITLAGAGAKGAGAYLAGAWGAGITLAGAGAMGAGAYLAGAWGAGITFAGAMGAGAYLAGAWGAGMTFAGAMGAGATLVGACGAGRILVGACGAGMTFAGAWGAGATLVGACGAGITLAGATGAGATLAGAWGAGMTLPGYWADWPTAVRASIKTALVIAMSSLDW